MSMYASVSRSARTAMAIVVLAASASACSNQLGQNLTGPSNVNPLAARPSVSASGVGTTTVAFDDFDAATMTVTVLTTTTSGVGQPYIDEGKIHLLILVDGLGNPLPCGSTGTWVRFDGAGGGLTVSGGSSSRVTDLAALKAACGDSICIRAQYVTGGGPTKVDTHFSDPTPFDVECPSGCTYSQGYWKNHETAYPADVLANGLTLGTVNYSAAQLDAILETPTQGNGLVSLAHQLIAAMLNVENGASDAAISSALTSAHGLIGSLVIPPAGAGYLAPSATGALTTTLDQYNNGIIGPGHCAE